jgi:flagellar hook-length control protein FliK
LKSGIVSQISVSSADLGQGQALSSVLQEVAALQGSGPNHPTVPTVVVDLAPTAPQSQTSQAAASTPLTSSSVLHTAATASSLSLSDAKATSSTLSEAYPIKLEENASAQASNGQPSQDASPDHGGQKSSDSSSSSSDSFSVVATPPKTQFPAIADVFAAVPAAKPDLAQTSPVASAALPVPPTPPSLSDSSARPTAEPLPSAPPQAQQSLPALQTPDAPSGRFVNDAQLVNASSQSEMRIAMQTNKLGAIEIQARVSGDGIGANIIVEKRDAHAALAVELPALQQALSDKQLRVEQVALTQGSLSSTAGDAGGNAQHQQRGAGTGTTSSPQTASFWNETTSLTTAAWFVTEQTGFFNAQGRLSVQA